MKPKSQSCRTDLFFEKLFKDYPLYSQEHEEDPLVIAKLFDPAGSATWYLTEYIPVEKKEVIKDSLLFVLFKSYSACVCGL